MISKFDNPSLSVRELSMNAHQTPYSWGNPDALIQRIDSLKPSKRQQKNVLFKEIYPSIERALARDVTQKVIVAELADMGLPLSIGGFRSLLEEERQNRDKDGHPITCEHCGARLPHETSTDSTAEP